MTRLDLAALRRPEDRPDLPTQPATITGEQWRNAALLVRLQWPCGRAAWVPETEIVILRRAA
jgi:hypothetical protein